jgi:hypothetical protein
MVGDFQIVQTRESATGLFDKCPLSEAYFKDTRILTLLVAEYRGHRVRIITRNHAIYTQTVIEKASGEHSSR